MPVEEYDPANDPTEAQKAGDARKDYESDPQTEPREAAPPDGTDEDWTQVHPNASREALEIQEADVKAKTDFPPAVPPEVLEQQKADDAARKIDFQPVVPQEYYSQQEAEVEKAKTDDATA